MKLTIAKSAGYCFGVKRAVNMVYQEAEEAKVPVYTYGPIIHNEEVVRDLKQRGVHVVRDLRIFQKERLSSVHTVSAAENMKQ